MGLMKLLPTDTSDQHCQFRQKYSRVCAKLVVVPELLPQVNIEKNRERGSRGFAHRNHGLGVAGKQVS